MFFFLGVRFPGTIPNLLKTVSYPAIAFLVILRWKRIPYIATRDIFLILSFGLAIASILWTVVPTETSNGLRGSVRTLLFAAYITARYTAKEQMKLWLWVLGIALILSLLVIGIAPGYASGREGGWQGIFPYKNFLGYTMSLMIVLCLNYIIISKRKNVLLFIGIGLAALLVVLARSSASIITSLVLVSLIPVYHLVKQHYKMRLIIFCIACIIAMGIGLLIIVNMDTILVDILGEGLSFNGRTPIWTLAIQKGMERAWLGYGANAFWSSDAGIFVMINTWAGLREGFNSHNAFIETFLSLGIVGLALSIITLLNVIFRVVTVLIASKKIEFFWLLQLQIFTIIVNLADSYDTGLIGSVVTLTAGLEWSRLWRQHNKIPLISHAR